MTSEDVDMIDNVIAFLIGAIIVACIGVGIDRDNYATNHECIAPCNVVLPRDTLEDEFTFDYGWRDAHTSIVHVQYDGNGDAR
jgi:hypothetical protein